MNILFKFINSAYLKATSNKVRVLAYHDVPDAISFEKQLKYLKEEYNVIGIIELRDFLYSHKKLPKKSVLITFDDGDYSVLTNGLPLLQKFNLQSVLFVITELIDSSSSFWWKQVETVYQNKGVSYEESRKQVNKLKSMSNKERVLALRELEPVTSTQLTLVELRLMESSGMKIGNHTHTHPMIDKCETPEIYEELKASREKFEIWELDGYPIFAYPNGNWDNNSESVLKENGIEMSFLFDHKLNVKVINPLRISRIRVNTYAGLDEFKLKVSGLHSLLMHSGITSLLKK